MSDLSEAIEGKLKKIIYDWEKRREFLNVSPESTRKFFADSSVEMGECVSETISDRDEEIGRLRERLDIGPMGEDAIDAAESANGFLRHRIEVLEGAIEPFRRVAGRLFETNANASDLVFEGPYVKHMPAADLTAGDFFAVAAALNQGASDAP